MYDEVVCDTLALGCVACGFQVLGMERLTFCRVFPSPQAYWLFPLADGCCYLYGWHNDKTCWRTYEHMMNIWWTLSYIMQNHAPHYGCLFPAKGASIRTSEGLSCLDRKAFDVVYCRNRLPTESDWSTERWLKGVERLKLGFKNLAC